MMLKNLNKFLEYSGVWLGVVLNPYHWKFRISTQSDSDVDDWVFYFEVYFGPVWLRVIIDDGRW